MQSLFRNPLADPSILGVSSGAALGAVLAMTVFAGAFATEICALFGGLTAAFAVYKLGAFGGRASAFSTLLAGIAVNAFCGAIVGFFMYSARDVGLRGYVFWSLGSLDRCGWPDILAAAAAAVPSWIAILLCARPLNLMLLGRQQAFHSGVNVGLVWVLAGSAAALATSASVAICGIIGFVGLVVPHMVRTVSGPRQPRPSAAVRNRGRDDPRARRRRRTPMVAVRSSADRGCHSSPGGAVFSRALEARGGLRR